MVTKSAFNDARQFYTERSGLKEKAEVAEANRLMERSGNKEEITTAANISGGPQGVAGTYPYHKKKKKKRKNEQEGDNEEIPSDPAEFISQRRSSSEGIAASAEEKGGASMLTAWHFNAKLPEYDECLAALEEGETPSFFAERYRSLLDRLQAGGMDAQDFQETSGKLEVWGEVTLHLGGQVGEPEEEPEEPAEEPEPEEPAPEEEPEA